MKYKSETCPYPKSLRSCIFCDACAAPNPPSRCGTCQMTYYCHEACAKNHWQVHKAYCKSPKDILQQSNLVLVLSSNNSETGKLMVSSSESSETNDAETKRRPCDWCLIESEVSLYNYKTADSDSPCCKRRFCLSCISQYEQISLSLMTLSSSSKANPMCPGCQCKEPRGEDIQTEDTAALNAAEKIKFQLLQAALWAAKAASASSLIESDRNEKFRRVPHQHPLLMKYANKGLDYVEALLDQDPNNAAAKILQGRILGLIGTPDLGLTLLKEAVQKLASASSSPSAAPVDRQKKVDELTDQVKQHMARAEMDQAEALLEEIQNMREQKFVLFVHPHDIVEVRLTIARLELQKKDFMACQAALKEIVAMASEEEEKEDSKSASLTPGQLLNVYLLFAKCFLEMEQYDKAIEASKLAIVMNRHYPRVYNELVEAHYAKGDVQWAKCASSQAVLYETPWDEQTKRIAQQTYTDLFGYLTYTEA